MEKNSIESSPLYQSIITSFGFSLHENEKRSLLEAFDYFRSQKEGVLAIDDPRLVRILSICKIIVSDLGLGFDSIISAVLSEAEQMNEILITDSGKWGKSCLTMVSGLRQLRSLNFKRIEIESENFRKLILLLSGDLRVILVRMAILYYELKTATPGDSENELLIRKIKYIFIPFAHRLGLYKLKSEMEELSMRLSYPDIYSSIEKKVADLKPKQQAVFNSFIQPIKGELERNAIKCEIKWRFKSVPSIWAKMKAQGVDVDGIYDLFAIRLIASCEPHDEKAVCWRIYSIISNIYKPSPSRLRDWISAPKASGYESLHTTVQTDEGRWIEVQIRTERMDFIAESGDAAHWRYKEKGGGADQLGSWMAQVRSLLENNDPDSLGEIGRMDTKDAIGNSIYVVTPKGDVKQLPVNATVLDFAFEIHSNVGATCNGAKVNGKIVPIRHILNNADVVEIITSAKQRPKADWLNIVVTNRAKNRIRQALNESLLRDADLGREVLHRKLRNWKLNLSDEQIEKIIKTLKYKNANEFYAAIGSEQLDPMQIKSLLNAQPEESQPDRWVKQERRYDLNTLVAKSGANNQLIIEGAGNMVSYTLAKCCSPIYGDKVFGFITISKGVTIHRTDCPNARDMHQRYPHRLVEVLWRKTTEDSQPYQTTVQITGDDRIGLLNDITQVINKDLKINLLGVSIESKNGQFDGRLKVHVFNTDQLHELLFRLSRITGVEKARRYSEG